jgi:hypothetical protein
MIPQRTRAIVARLPALMGFLPGALVFLALGYSSLARGETNITTSELKVGVWQHDPSYLGGTEKGIDVNLEVIFASPISDAWADSLPSFLRFAAQPRPTIGASYNTDRVTNPTWVRAPGDLRPRPPGPLTDTSRGTDQLYLGGTWAWQLVQGLVNQEDALEFAFFFGPGFNDGQVGEKVHGKEALGSNLLFREAFELGYQINPEYEVSTYLDHISNGGLEHYNRSLNDVGIRFGVRF